jgi:hypothetical protein
MSQSGVISRAVTSSVPGSSMISPGAEVKASLVLPTWKRGDFLGDEPETVCSAVTGDRPENLNLRNGRDIAGAIDAARNSHIICIAELSIGGEHPGDEVARGPISGHFHGLDRCIGVQSVSVDVISSQI